MPENQYDYKMGRCPFTNDRCRKDCVFHSEGCNVNVSYTECLIQKAIRKIIWGV